LSAKHASLARPSVLEIRELASTFKCDVWVSKDDENGKWQKHHGPDDARRSQGSKLLLHRRRLDANESLIALEKLINQKFDED
jgi:phosphotransferase system HPr-like phosphotransfer protein